MGGGGTNTSTTSSQSTDPQVTSTLDQLLRGVSSAQTAGAAVNPVNLYAGTGATTNNAQAASLAAAANPDYASGVSGAIANLAPVAAGQDLGDNDPGYSALRSKLSSDVMGDVGSSFTNSGRFGGGSYVNAATNDLTSALGGLDMQNQQDQLTRQQNAITDLPTLFSALQAPSATAGAVGSAQDADSQAQLTGSNDLFNRTNNSNLTLLQQLSGILSGSAPAAGTTTTSSTPATPWWQSALGIGAALL